MRRQDLERVRAEMTEHESILKALQRAKRSGNFRRDPSLKRFIPMHHVVFLDFKDKIQALLDHVNSRNHSKKQLQLLFSRAQTLDTMWTIELRHYFN